MFGRFENIILYIICTLIWGSTWFVITLQVDETSPTTSVFYRFLMSSGILLAWCFFRKVNMHYAKKDHLRFAAQGIFLFSVNYMLTYTAETLVSSGLVAMSFTALIYFNMFGMRIFFQRAITKKVVLGSLLGGLGIIFIFLNEILNFDPNSKTLLGLGIGVLATLAASTGNMFAQKNYELKIPVVVTNTYGMIYGATFTLLVLFIRGDSLSIPLTGKFLGAMAYLALFGSVIAFGAYLSLAGKIGAERAAYSTVISPVIALIISSFFEGFMWTPYIATGVALCLLGNALTLTKKKAEIKAP